MDGYEELANAIVISAVDDYRSARKILIREPDNVLAQAELDRCEKFFLSHWFATLSKVDGLWLLKELKNEVQ